MLDNDTQVSSLTTDSSEAKFCPRARVALTVETRSTWAATKAKAKAEAAPISADTHITRVVVMFTCTDTYVRPDGVRYTVVTRQR